ncbi:MAG: hypothetical protein Q9161_008554 [Pseudevernia consocians]
MVTRASADQQKLQGSVSTMDQHQLRHYVNNIPIPNGPPSCYPATIDRRTHVPIVSFTPTDLASQQLVYTLILRLLSVYNILFNPPIETYTMPGPPHVVICGFQHRPQTTLEHWDAVWAAQTLLPTDEQGMTRELVHLRRKRDYACVMNVGGPGRFQVLQSYLCGYEAVEGTIALAARRAAVVLVERIG